MEICVIEGCSNPVRVKSRGLCNKHYRRWQTHGDPEHKSRRYYTDPEEAWIQSTEKSGDCLIWTGTQSGNGYGTIRYKGVRIGAHRYAWIREFGEIDETVHLDHHVCYNTLCVSVQHLRATTNQKNSWNKADLNTNNTSGHRNVVWDAVRKKWAVQIKKNGINHHFGRFDKLEDAARVADEKRKELFGEFAGRG